MISIEQADKIKELVALIRKADEELSDFAWFSSGIANKDAEYGERARKAEANEGIDWKALSHACRGGLQLLEIYKTGDLVYPLQDAPFILDVKLGKHPFKTVQEFLEDVVDQVEAASIEASKNGMQQKVDMSFWDDFLEKVYLENHRSYYK